MFGTDDGYSNAVRIPQQTLSRTPVVHAIMRTYGTTLRRLGSSADFDAACRETGLPSVLLSGNVFSRVTAGSVAAAQCASCPLRTGLGRLLRVSSRSVADALVRLCPLDRLHRVFGAALAVLAGESDTCLERVRWDLFQTSLWRSVTALDE